MRSTRGRPPARRASFANGPFDPSLRGRDPVRKPLWMDAAIPCHVTGRLPKARRVLPNPTEVVAAFDAARPQGV
jgi:hypothetical protein